MTIQDVYDATSQAPITNAVAGAAVVSPVWLPYLQTASDISTLLLPVAGLAWLLIQMVSFFIRKRK